MWPAIIAAVGSLAAGGLSLASQVNTNKKNKQMSDDANQLTRENNEWQKQRYFDEKAYNQALQQQMFEREDTSYQRTVDDIQKSGLSPLAINGTNDSGSVVGLANAPELQQVNPFQQNSLNFGQLADIIGQADSRRLEERALDIQEEKNLSDTEQKELDRKESARQADEKLETSKAQFDATLNQKIKEFEATNKKEAEKLEQEKKRVNALLQQTNIAQTKADAEEAERQLKQMTGGRGSTKRYTNKADYEEAMTKWREQFAEQLKQYAIELGQVTSESRSESESNGLNIMSNGLTDTYSKSDSRSWSNLDEKAKAGLNAWLAKNPMPVYW